MVCFVFALSLKRYVMITAIGIKLKLIFGIILRGNLVIVFVQNVQESSTRNLTRMIRFQDNYLYVSQTIPR